MFWVAVANYHCPTLVCHWPYPIIFNFALFCWFPYSSLVLCWWVCLFIVRVPSIFSGTKFHYASSFTIVFTFMMWSDYEWEAVHFYSWNCLNFYIVFDFPMIKCEMRYFPSVCSSVCSLSSSGYPSHSSPCSSVSSSLTISPSSTISACYRLSCSCLLSESVGYLG